MRNGPKPLPLQLGMASMAAAGLAGGTQFDAAILQDFFLGIKKYQGHDFKREMPPLSVVWQDGQARLLRSPAQNDMGYNTLVVVIPSMINKSDILDLLPERSFVRWLSSQGFDVYMLDWGAPSMDEGQQSIDSIITHKIIPAIESIGLPVFLMGYCMGGVFCAAASYLRPDLFKGLLLLATPWNFDDKAGALKARLSLMKPMALPYMRQHGQLPDSWMQAVFATLDPESSIRKFSSFARMKEGDSRERIFVAVEDWLNDGVDIPSNIARICMDDWYENNAPYKGEWVVCGQTIHAKDIKTPTFVVAASQDKIVPIDSSIAFAEQRLKCDRLVCNTGHIGLMAGSKVVEQVWTPISEWFAAQQ